TRKNVGNVDKLDRNGWKLGAGWSYAPGSSISAIVGSLEQKNSTAIAGFVTAGQSPKVDIWILNWEHMMGQWLFIAQYAHFGKLKNSIDETNTDAQGYTIAAKYFLSKRTGVYASFNQIKNKDRAFWDMSNAGTSSAAGAALPAASAGADPRIF